MPAADVRAAARLYATGGNGAIYYGLGVTEHSQGSTMVMGMANLAMATGNLGRDGVGVNPLRGQNNVQGSCDMGSFPHELSGYRHVSDDGVRTMFEALWGHAIQSEPGLRIPNMFDAAIDGHFKGLFVQGEDIAQSDPNTVHVMTALRSMELLVVQDLFVNETAKLAHVFFPGTSFLEKDGTFTNAERRINRVRPVDATAQRQAGVGGRVRARRGARRADALRPRQRDHGRDRRSSPRRSPACRSPSSTRSAACSGRATTQQPLGTPIMHEGTFVRGLGKFNATPYVATEERSNRRFPLLLTTGRILSQYNVGAQTRRTDNVAWHREDVLEIHPHDAEERGISRRRRGHAGQSSRRHHAARRDLRPHAAGCRLHDVPPSRQRRQRGDHRVERLGHQLPGVQGHRGAGLARPLGRDGGDWIIPSTVSARWCAWPTRSPGSSPHETADDAVAAVATHLDRFWEHEMRVDLARAIEGGTVTVDPLVVQAMDRLAVTA